jgi:ATP-dependent Lhr-like helicase
MEICGPTTSEELATQLHLEVGEISSALGQLESEGQVLRGHYRAPAQPVSPATLEWCDRRLLQRIHRLTVGKLRREIEPLSSRDFMRFLFRWHHLEPQDRLRGKGGLLKAVSLLEGYEAPAAAWEQVLLPARMHLYTPDLLERACWDGELAWGRLTRRETRAIPGPRRGASSGEPPMPTVGRRSVPGRNANITFLWRQNLDSFLAAARPGEKSEGPLLLPEELLSARGALFFQDLVAASGRISSEVEDALWELLARGVVSSDAVENLRVLQSPKRRRRQRARQRGGPGRWCLLVPAQISAPSEVHEAVARLFLQRYGIVWRDLALREPLAPSWRELLYVYRRMEARGQIRGGRFISGFAGEQFALPEAVDIARAVRRAALGGQKIILSAVDPLNLTGVVTAGPRVPALLGNTVTYVDGNLETDDTEIKPSTPALPEFGATDSFPDGIGDFRV